MVWFNADYYVYMKLYIKYKLVIQENNKIFNFFLKHKNNLNTFLEEKKIELQTLKFFKISTMPLSINPKTL